MNPTYIWLMAGIALVIFDALHLGGIGLFFAGLGAIVTGAALQLGLLSVEGPVAQWITFFASTAVFAALLWKPVQKFRAGRTHSYNNIVGETAYVGSNGLTRRGGEVTWSGTIMKAELAKGVLVEKLDAGAQVTVVEVKGATLIVKPKE